MMGQSIVVMDGNGYVGFEKTLVVENAPSGRA